MDRKIKTERLTLRAWREEDLEPFAEMNADPRVREFFPGLLTRDESNETAKVLSEHIVKHGWGLWATSLNATDEFIGFIGIGIVDFIAPFTPAVEIGWRLAYNHWGKGYATEGALQSLKYGFEIVGLHEIVSFTTEKNHRSRNVMQKIGMRYDPKDEFNHPKLKAGHPLIKHVLYRMESEEWRLSNLSGSPVDK